MIRWPFHRKLRIALALALAFIVMWGSDRLAQSHAHLAAHDIVKEHLTVGLTPYVLGDDSLPPDDLSLYLWMHQVKQHLSDLTFGHWASPGQLELLWIVRIGDTAAMRPDEWVKGREPRVHTVRWRAGENQYEAAWTGEYARNPKALLAVGALSLAAFLLVGWWVPVPLRAEQWAWYHRLLADGEDPRVALQTAQNPRIPREGISDCADARFEQLRACGVAAASAMEWVLCQEVETLSDTEWAWFLIELSKSGPDFNRCLERAWAPDSLEVRFEPPSLWIRGIEVPMASAALTYYALYARHRAAGEGWIENPRAGAKPALGPGSLQEEFLVLCDELSTHKKTTEAVDTKGISDKDLHNNRNRIQTQILDALALPDAGLRASELTALAAAPYLFESQPVPGKDRNAFRIRLDSARIRLG